VLFDAVFNRQKTRTVTRSFGTRILRFSREMKLKNSAKIIQNSQSDQGGGVAPSPPPLNTPLIPTPRWSYAIIRSVCLSFVLYVFLSCCQWAGLLQK